MFVTYVGLKVNLIRTTTYMENCGGANDVVIRFAQSASLIEWGRKIIGR